MNYIQKYPKKILNIHNLCDAVILELISKTALKQKKALIWTVSAPHIHTKFKSSDYDFIELIKQR